MSTSGPPSSRARKAARPPRPPRQPVVDELVRARCDEPAPPEVVRAAEQFNSGLFFEQHETLETLWRATPSPVRDLYRGILQVGVAFHHWRSGNHHGAAVLLDEGIRRLRPFAPRCQQVDVEALVAAALAARARLDELGPQRMAAFDLADAPRLTIAPGVGAPSAE